MSAVIIPAGESPEAVRHWYRYRLSRVESGASFGSLAAKFSAITGKSIHPDTVRKAFERDNAEVRDLLAREIGLKRTDIWPDLNTRPDSDTVSPNGDSGNCRDRAHGRGGVQK